MKNAFLNIAFIYLAYRIQFQIYTTSIIKTEDPRLPVSWYLFAIVTIEIKKVV